MLPSPSLPAANGPVLIPEVNAALVRRRVLQGTLMHTLLRLRGIVLLPVLTRALEPAGMGVVTLGGAVGGLLAPWLTLGVPLGAALVLADLRERDVVARTFSSIAQFSVVMAVSGATLFGLGLSLELRPSALAPLAPYAPMLAAWLGILSLKELATLIPSLRQDTHYLVRLNLLMEYGGAVLAIAAALSGLGPGGVLSAFAAGIALGAIPSLVRSWRLCGFVAGIDRGALRAALHSGLPFLAIASGQWVLQSLDNLFLAAMHGAAAVGVYGVSYTLASGVLLVYAVINFFYFPTAVSLWREGVERLVGFLEPSYRLSTLVLGLFLAESCLLGPWLVELLAGPAYREAGRVLPLVVLAYGAFTYLQLLQFVPMVVLRRSAPAAARYLPAALLNVALNLLLIPRWALLGAATATALSYCAAAYLMGRLARRALPAFERWRPLLRAAPVIALTSIAALQLAVDREASVLAAASAAASLVAVYALLAWLTAAIRLEDWRSLRDAG